MLWLLYSRKLILKYIPYNRRNTFNLVLQNQIEQKRAGSCNKNLPFNKVAEGEGFEPTRAKAPTNHE